MSLWPFSPPAGWSGADPVAAAERRLAALVDPDLGIIQEAAGEPPVPGEPDFALVTARLAAVERLVPIAGFSPFASGTAPDVRTARVRALGEAVERYAGFLCPAEAGPYAAYPDLPGRGIDPADWPRCTPAEYAAPGNPLAPPDRGRRYRWLPGWSLLRREPVYVPASQVCLGYVPGEPAECFILPHSTGLAAGESLEAAALSGLCEVLERDALMLTWCKELPAPRLMLPATGWPEVAERLWRVERWGLRVSLHALLPQEPPAKVLALIWDRAGGVVPVACGLGASPDPRRAVAKALDEAVQSRRGLLAMATHPGTRIPERPDQVLELPDHLAYYLRWERLAAFGFLHRAPALPAWELAGVPHRSDEPAGPVLERLVQGLGRQGYEVIGVEITPADLAAAGLRVVRVVVPGLIPLAHGHAMRFRAMPRWERFPGAFTDAPHPFG